MTQHPGGGTPRRPRLAGPLFILVPLLAGLLAGAWPANAAAGGKERLDAYLKGLTSLQADFTQFTFNADRSRMMESKGTFFLRRPGRFRWEYKTPNKQVIIADGSRVYVHDVDLNQVSHQGQEKALRGTPALLLAGNSPIAQDFHVNSIESTDGRDWVSLRPKATETDIRQIELGFGPDGLESLIMEDNFGQTTRLNFSRIKRNPALDLSLFKMEQKVMDDFLSFD